MFSESAVVETAERSNGNRNPVDDLVEDPARFLGCRSEATAPMRRDSVTEDQGSEIAHIFGDAVVASVDDGTRLCGTPERERATGRGAEGKAVAERSRNKDDA